MRNKRCDVVYLGLWRQWASKDKWCLNSRQKEIYIQRDQKTVGNFISFIYLLPYSLQKTVPENDNSLIVYVRLHCLIILSVWSMLNHRIKYVLQKNNFLGKMCIDVEVLFVFTR